jgi:hypothetical protein
VAVPVRGLDYKLFRKRVWYANPQSPKQFISYAPGGAGERGVGVSRKVAVAVVLITGVLATACSSSSAPKPATASAGSSAPPSVAATPTVATAPSSPSPKSARDLAAAEVVTFVPSYYASIDRLASSLMLSLNELDSITTGANTTLEKTALAEYRANGWAQQGKTVVVATEVSDVDLTNEPTATPPVLPTVHVTACIDVTKVRAIDKTGKSVTLPTRADFFVESLTVVNVAYPSSSGWRVRSARNKGASSCA